MNISIIAASRLRALKSIIFQKGLFEKGLFEGVEQKELIMPLVVVALGIFCFFFSVILLAGGSLVGPYKNITGLTGNILCFKSDEL